MKSLVTYLIIAVITIIAIDCLSQSIIWRQIIGGQYDETAFNCIQLKNRAYLMAGWKQIPQHGSNLLILHSYLVKLDEFGNILWEKLIGDSISANETVTVGEDSQGNIFLPYRTEYSHMMKLDFNGNILWDKDYSNLGIVIFRMMYFIDDNTKILLLGDNEIQVPTTTSITKMDTSGNVIWTKPYYDSIPSIYAYRSGNHSLTLMPDSYFFCGERGSVGFIIRTDTSGNVMWNKKFLSTGGIYSISKNSESTFMASGRPNHNYALYCLKFNSLGDSLFARDYTTDTSTWGLGYEKILRRFDGNFAIGTTCGTNNGRLGVIDSTGNIIYNYHYPYPSFIDICQLNFNATYDSGFVFAGSYGVFAKRDELTDAIIYKIDKKGNTVGIMNYSSPDQILQFSIYPNPSNNNFNFDFVLNSNSQVEINLIDIIGKIVKPVFQNFLTSGFHSFKINAFDLCSGVYFLYLKTNMKKYSKRVLIIK